MSWRDQDVFRRLAARRAKRLRRPQPPGPIEEYKLGADDGEEQPARDEPEGSMADSPVDDEEPAQQ